MFDILFSTQAWALESRYFNQVKPIILKRLSEGHSLDDLFSTPAQQSLIPTQVRAGGALVRTFESTLRTSSQSQTQDAVNVQVISLKGAMNKNGGYCSYGTAQIAAALQDAYKNPDVGAIVLHVDSPGGAVDGTEYLGNVVKQANKPVVAFVDGLAASAAYWVSSQTSHIMMSSKTTSWVGSIGTLIMHVDQSGWLAKEGFKVTYITADASVDKVKGNSYEPLTQEATDAFKKDLNAINDTFIDTVKAGRGSKLTSKVDLFTGSLFNGKEAIEYGLADSTGTLKDAINKAASLSRAQKNQKSTHSPNSNANMKFPKLSALFGADQNASADAEVTEVQAAQAESALTEKDTQISTLQAQLTEKDNLLAAKDQEIAGLKATHQTEIDGLKATHQTEIDGLKAEIQTLEGWREAAKAKDGRQQDQLNALGQQPIQLTGNQETAQEYLDDLKKSRKK